LVEIHHERVYEVCGICNG